ncbi:glycerate kinase family protein [Defluviitalea phaphyphila]|uniref:glycerate kinase family protein n=1 Tax=Defluviitalea phaphyphila TaxID=1473580 RepID=UPI000731D373|nr:glycerate kinase [Defluviitalea phaphyphila]
MKVVIAIDSLKGSLSSIEAGKAIKEGILRAINAEVVIKPLADGGEGTTEAFVEGFGGEYISVDVTGPLGKPVKATYGYLKESKTAIMEMAAASGITLVDPREKNPMKATSYGVGEMIKDAIKKGCRQFILGIGGSATNDGGIGMLAALGFEFLDSKGKAVSYDGEGLAHITSIKTDKVLKELRECKFKIACDVNNPLYGPNGATYVFGPQKGVTNEMKEILDNGMKNYAKVTKLFMKNDYAKEPGAGAAGGLGFACISYLNATLEPGISLILDAINLENDLKDADYVITGEGRLDYQTSMGKAPIGVAKLAKKYNCKVIALAGSVTKDAIKCNEEGIDAYFSILTQVVSLKEAMDKEIARSNIIQTTEQIFKLIKTIKEK